MDKLTDILDFKTAKVVRQLIKQYDFEKDDVYVYVLGFLDGIIYRNQEILKEKTNG